MRTGKLFTCIFTKSSPAGTFLSDSELLPNTEQREQMRETAMLSILKLCCYDRALYYLLSTMNNNMPRKTEVGQQFDELSTSHLLMEIFLLPYLDE